MPSIQSSIDDRGIACLTLDRPQVRNAIDRALIAEARTALAVFRADPRLRAVVIRGNGKDFCAGVDLAWMREVAQLAPEAIAVDSEPLQALYAAIDSLPVPVIALVQGNVMAGGLGIAAASDAVIAVRGASFALSETRLGLVPALVAPFLQRKIGASMLRYLAVTGVRESAERMRDAGLVHVIAETMEEADAQLAALVDAALAVSPDAVRMAKAMLVEQQMRSLPEAMPQALDWVARSRGERCAKEGIDAFLARQPPPWARG